MSDNLKNSDEIANEIASRVLDVAGDQLKEAARDLAARAQTRPAAAPVAARNDGLGDDLDEDLNEDLDGGDYDDGLDDYDPDQDDLYAGAQDRRFDVHAVDLGLNDGEVVYQRFAAKLAGADAVLARTSQGVRVATPAKGDLPGTIGFIGYGAYDNERSGASQDAAGAWAVIIAARQGVPISVNGVQISPTELQSFHFEVEREALRVAGQSPADAVMRAGWTTTEVATVTRESRETLTADQVPQPEVEGLGEEGDGDVRMRDVAADEPDAPQAQAPAVAPAPGGSMDRIMAELEAVRDIERLEKEGTLTKEQARARKKAILGV